ncbi:uncharacterized protein LOC128244832 [Mya arenaria]|uniref:uncharacterized protein LOC128244832 n=1 Tax=Mya arenaria TaxID=6604 RepID=UPI0022E3C5BE|nr:uncharacterized protein LOC128244832 [Mya arenaria]
MESRLLIYYFILGGLVGLTGQDLRQLNDDRRLKMPEYRERTLDRKLPSSTKRDDSHFGLSKNLLPFEINTNDIALIKPKSYVDGKKRNVIKRNAMVFKNLAVNKKCKMKVDQRTVSTFIYRVWRFESRYVFMGLRPENGSGIKIRSSPDVINGNIWTWTFWDKNEAQEFLRWPIEFGIWSMGILYHSVLRQPQVLPVVLKRVSGDCSHLTVGNVKDDLAISRALNAITLGLMRNNSDGEKYGPSYYCYSRKRNVPAYMQIICENIVCPFEGIEKECCVYRFNRTNMKRNVICPEFKYIYDTISWNVPILLAIILFIYFPMLLLFVAHKFFDSVRSTYVRLNRTEQGFTESDDSYHEQGLNGHNHTVEIYLLEGYKHVSFFQTLFMPLASLKRVTVTLQKRFLFLVVGRLTRVVFPFITLSIIGIQAYVDYSNLKNFIKTSVKLGVPYGLRSIITGYEMSRTNFLPFLGGPFVALACYVVVTTVLLMIPKSLPEFLAKGLGPKLNGQCANANNTELHPMSESINTLERSGSLMFTDKSTGYLLLYRFTVSQVLMVLNVSFWKTSIAVQHDRWKRIYHRSCHWCIIFLFPMYLVICIVELAWIYVIHGLPIISFGRLVITSYCSALPLPKKTPICRIFAYILKLFTFTAVLFFLYMLCVVFLETILFLTRICVFSYTAMILVPKIAYGFLIFYFTIFFYLWDAINDFSLYYNRLFHDSIKAAMYVHRTRRSRVDGLLCKVRGRRGIRQSIFEIIIEAHNPRRRQIVTTCLKVAVILFLMWVAIDLLTKTNKFKDLHTIMHVGTAIIVCAMPQILKRMCHQRESKLLRREFRKKLAATILSHLGYFVYNEETSGDSEESRSD